MAHRFDQGILSHTATARPFWVGDVDVHRHQAPRFGGSAPYGPVASNGLRRTLSRMLTALTGR